MRTFLPVLLTLTFMAWVHPASVQAQPSPFQNTLQDRAREAVRSGDYIPLSRIVRRLQRQTPGKMLDANLNGDTYSIRWLANDGRRIDYQVDATTGRILSSRGN